MKLIKKKIGDIALQIKTGKTPSTLKAEYFNGDINWYTPGDFSKGKYLKKSTRTITSKAIDDNKAVVYDGDTVLITCIGDIGKVGITTERASSNQQITGIKLKKEVSPDFFYYWCKRHKKLFEKNAKQAVVAILNNATLSEIEISYPEKYDDQIRIAAVLTRAEKLIAKRKESIKALDELLKSTFLEMFGDPVRNEKGWETHTLKALCEKITDGTHDTPERLNSGIKFITGKHIRPFQIDYQNSDYVNEEVHREIYKRCNPEFGDILYTNIGVNLGTAAMNSANYEFSMKNVALLKLKKHLFIPRFSEHILNNENQKNAIINNNSSGGAQKFLSLGQISQIEVALPPVNLQNQFASIVEKVESLKAKYTQSHTELENLYGLLSQQAFKGELDLSKVTVDYETKTEMQRLK